MKKSVRIGTRGSRLALVQAEMTAKEIEKSNPKVSCELIVVKTLGDKNLISPLESFGGKAVFVDEFERMLLNNEIDIAVHSAKDMPVKLPDGLEVGAVLSRADSRDVLVYKNNCKSISVVGTSSKRRTAQLEALYPGASCKALRGNVPTRIEKMKNGEYDAVVLAKAGLDRLGIFEADDALCYDILSVDDMVPAACQGIIAAECRADDAETIRLLTEINDEKAAVSFEHERLIMNLLDASCTQAVGAIEIDGCITVMKKIGDEIKKKKYSSFDLAQIEKDFM